MSQPNLTKTMLPLLTGPNRSVQQCQAISMALSRYILSSPSTHPSINPRTPIPNLRFDFQFIATSRITKRSHFKLPFSARSSYGNDAVKVTSDGEHLLKAMQSFLPGGSWWNLPNDSKQHLNSSTDPARPITVWESLLRMWKLLDNHHWIIFLAFASLIVAAVRFQCFYCRFDTISLRVFSSAGLGDYYAEHISCLRVLRSERRYDIVL